MSNTNASAEQIQNMLEEAQSLIDPILTKYGCTFMQLRSKSRMSVYAVARQEIYVRLRRQRNWSYAKIGFLFGKHHATILHSVRNWDAVHGKQDNA